MSNQYNKHERMLAQHLSKIPFIKQLVKNLYSRASYILNKPTNKYISSKTIHQIYPDRVSSFFGYYDKSPENISGLILVHSNNSDTSSLPSSYENVKISVFSNKNLKKPIVEFDSKAFNWQQGSRTQWVTEDQFIFNDFDIYNNRFIARLVSVSKNKELAQYPQPIQDGFKKEYYLSINYKRLHTLRPDYGYSNLGKMCNSELDNIQNDGIWKVVYSSGKTTLITSLESIINFDNKATFSSAKHKVNHLMISPKGDKFVFLHRYFLGSRKFDRLILADSNGNLISILSDFEMVSHYFWINNNELIAYMRGPSGEDGFYIIDTQINKISKFAEGIHNGRGDGHPHVYNDFVIIDSYPNKARMQVLSKFDISTGKEEILGHFFHSFSFKGQSRCDLHPRVSLDGKHVYFDSIHSGERHLYQMEL